ncbi:polysaccharide deacetylase [Cohnella sp. CIP 111063]|uniref:polysaccharide deacetylase family protein n=1 Tax=unclassified Cohnella TaxID=2636738 RepID=UPI000B8C5B3C|nr:MULTISPECIES: polysaccharide deacetylase family protein [unclassified Cohnella]OXS59320.1 polysaccharide deacetylase [Cohnella sp. CIP 111063]PRX72345.1 peptidoglycan/xylan/chitin deacetylase (PgdA/CDA1 family) [Cohnella sp. SGD-V74]
MTISGITRGNPEAAHCAFTFDDGPMRISIDPWLDALEQGGACGTFFLTGEWFDRHPAKAREMLARGHELATHTYHHRRMADVTKAVFFEELRLAELAYQEATGRPVPALIRFPYASYRDENMEWLREWNYLLIEGEDTVDWSGPPSAQLVERVIPKLVNGAIFMFHANEIAKETPQAVKSLVRHTRDRGFAAVSVSELLRANGIPTGERSWQVRFRPAVQGSFLSEQWKPVAGDDELQKLAADSLEWGNPKAPTGAGAYSKWLQALSTPVQWDDDTRFVARSFAGQHWAYVRATVRGDALVLEDFAAKEAHADALVYILQWAAHEASAFGCKWVTASQDMRRIHKLCEQLGLEAEIVTQD